MKRFFLVLVFFVLSSTSLLAEYRLEPVNCTIKKKDNCGAYLYNSKTGSTYFCNSTKCTEILEALEEASEEEVKGTTGSKKSKIPKLNKKKKKKSKIPKFKKKSN
tara:strand:- start:644 stop:958 length:315 start_codon:yes stop_codon:yes gene_type:complete